MGLWSKIKKGVKKATNAVKKAATDTGKFVQKNSGIIAAIGAVAGTVLTGGLAGPLVGAALGGIGKVTDSVKSATATASGISSAIGSISNAVPTGNKSPNNNNNTGSGSAGSVSYVSGSVGANGSISKPPMTTETKKKLTLGGAALAALSLIKFL